MTETSGVFRQAVYDGNEWLYGDTPIRRALRWTWGEIIAMSLRWRLIHLLERL